MGFSLQTFGGLRLRNSDGDDVAFPEKGLLILAYLLATRKPEEQRTYVASFLWGYEDKGSALTNLRKLVSRIKSRQAELDAQFLVFSDTAISIDQSALASDIAPVVADEIGQPFLRLALLRDRLSVDFLDKANCQSPVFTKWLQEQNNRHLEMLKHTLSIASSNAATKDEGELVKEAALLIFRARPEDEVIHRILLKAFDAEGEVEQLRRVFERRNALLSSYPSRPGSTPDNAEKAPGGKPLLDSVRQLDAEGSPDALAEKSPRSIIPRLILLPPNNHSENVGATLIASSLIEDITIGFCALNSLQVIAPYSAIQISRQGEDRIATFERHSISYILDTHLTGHDNDIALFSQLIFFSNNEILWAERFSLAQSDLARQRREISRRITLSVASQIERHELTRSYFEQNPTTYHRYLVGRQYLNRLTLPNLRRARKELKASLQESAEFAPALSSIARTYSKEWLLTARGDSELLKSAEEFATRAIRSRHDMADGYREFGVAKLLQGAIDESVEALELAETLGPHYADVIADHADTLVHSSRPGLALEKIERAIELNPLSPDSYLWTAAGANYALGRFDVTLEYIDRMIDGSLADRLSAASWAMLGNKERARFFVRRVREANPDFDVDKWLSVVPSKEQWHRDLYREGLKKAGF